MDKLRIDSTCTVLEACSLEVMCLEFFYFFFFASASGNLNHCSQNSRILGRYGNFFLFFPPGFIFPIFVLSLGITRGKKTSQSNRVQVS